jgi:intracellular septation protein
MKFLFDLFPVLLFFGMFKWGEGNPQAAQALATQYLSGWVSGNAVTTAQAPILLATVIVIAATFAQIAYLLACRKRVDPMLWVSLAIVCFFGGATIYFQNDTFIKCFCTVLLAGRILFKRNLIRTAMGKQITLPEPVWEKLSLAWTVFFSGMGLVNLYVAFNFSTAAWVNFKLFGFTGLMLAFVIGQSLFLSKYLKDPG